MKSIHVSVLDREGVDGADADAAVGPNVVLLIGWRARAIAALVVLAICASLGLSAWSLYEAHRARRAAEFNTTLIHSRGD